MGGLQLTSRLISNWFLVVGMMLTAVVTGLENRLGLSGKWKASWLIRSVIHRIDSFRLCYQAKYRYNSKHGRSKYKESCKLSLYFHRTMFQAIRPTSASCQWLFQMCTITNAAQSPACGTETQSYLYVLVCKVGTERHCYHRYRSRRL